MAQSHRVQIAVVFGISLLVLRVLSSGTLIPPTAAALAHPVAAAATPTNTRVPTPTPPRTPIGTPPPPPTRPPSPPPRPTPTPLAPPQLVPAAADAFVRAGANANRNFGADPTLLVKDGSDAVDRRAVVRFDLRRIAARSVRRVVLTLFVEELPNGVPAPVRTAAIANDTWSEATLTWNTQPTVKASEVSYSVTTTGWMRLDLTAYVNAQLATDTVVSLALFDDTTARRLIQWSSKEGAHPPMLEITP
jgi:hypothetical protein